MEEKIVTVLNEMSEYLSITQMKKLQEVIIKTFAENEAAKVDIENEDFLNMFLAAKRIEGCSERSVLGVANIVNRMYSKVDELPRTNANDNDLKKFGVKYGDMLFCRSSLVAEGIGKASIVPEDAPSNILFECHVIRLPLNLRVCVPEFMQTLSTMDFFRNQVISQSKTATMTTIGQNGILKTNIILPPIEKQREFYNFVHQVDKSKSCRAKNILKLAL